MRLENFTTKKFKREKWLLVCVTESYKNISQIKKNNGNEKKNCTIKNINNFYL